MRTKFLVALFAVFCLWSCKDWGELDPPAGNQQKPTLKQLASYTFDGLESGVSIGAYEGGKAPKLVVDKQLEVVLELDGGYVSYSNPLQFNTLQEAASLTGWVKLNESNEDTPIFCFSDESGSKKLIFTANSDLYYNEEKLNTKSLLLTAGEWHWFSVAVKPDSYAIYIDGIAVDESVSEDESVVASRVVASGEVMNFMAEASKLYFGYGSEERPGKMWIDEVSVYKNLITEKEIAKPELPEIDDSGDGGGEEEDSKIIVGNEDCSTPFFGAFSPILTSQGDCIFHYKFINHTNGANNWNNWCVVISNGKLSGEEGYKEYAFVRADNWGWLNGDGNNTIAASNYPLSNTYDVSNDWAVFREEMKGAIVDLTIKRQGSQLTMHADIVTKSGLNWTYDWIYGAIVADGELGVFLTVDGSYLEIDPKEAYVGNIYSQGSYVVGRQDNTTGFFGAHSSKVLLEGDGKIVYQFYNHTNKANVWNNYVSVITIGTHPSESGYSAADELLVLRADPFGWGSIYNEKAITTIDGMDVAKVDGALVTVSFTRKGTDIAYTASFEADGEVVTPYTYVASNFPENQKQWAAFFTVDNCWLDIISVVTYPLIANIK